MTLDATVIIPTTGTRRALLRRAIASVAAQSRQPAETLVVVDGDETLLASVASEAGPHAATFIATGSRRGASAARNFGASHARSRHLCFLDDDDAWKPAYLETVFDGAADFDVALTAFEKHGRDGARPEKVPPEALSEERFRVANPGLRGSNLVITREALASVGGFDEALVSFNDLDLGVRLSRRAGLRYRRVATPLVEYHAHDGERLSRRGSSAVETGMLAFLDRHEPSMTVRERVAFRSRAVSLWGVDPWAPARLFARVERAARDADVPQRFPGLLLALETTILESCAVGDGQVDDVQRVLDRLCRAFEQRRDDADRLERIRLAVITTDSPGAPERLIESLLREADRSGWRPAARAGEPWFELLLLENDTAPSPRAPTFVGLESLRDPRVRVLREQIAATERPLPTARARALAFERVRRLGWTPSHRAPVWFLDEDFRFETLLPSRERGYRLAPGGSLLHRAEQLIRMASMAGVAAIVGGNSMAAPVPVPGLLCRQLADLWCPRGHADAPWQDQESVRVRLARPDPYYDLTTDTADPTPVPWRTPWWRADGRWDWDEVFERIIRGLPVSRAALPTLAADGGAAWGSLERPRVSGGNTMLIAPSALRPELFVTHRWGSLVSRRADSVWCVRAQRAGAEMISAALPLAHDRIARSGNALELAVRDGLADALGVGVQRAFSLTDSPAEPARMEAAEARRGALVSGLRATLERLRREEAPSDMPTHFRERVLGFVGHLIDELDAVRFEVSE